MGTAYMKTYKEIRFEYRKIHLVWSVDLLALGFEFQIFPELNQLQISFGIFHFIGWWN